MSRVAAAAAAAPAPAPRNTLRRPPVVPPTFKKRLFAAVRNPSWPKVLGSSDGLLFGAVLALIVFGVVMVYSASSVRAVRVFGDGHHYLVRQALYAMVGVPLMIVLSRIDYHRYRALGKPVLFVAVALLLAVIFGAGRAAGGAARLVARAPGTLTDHGASPARTRASTSSRNTSPRWA